MSTTTVDQRAIGEVLLDADFTSRQLLLDVVGDDAPAMLRTWGEVVQAAGDLWTSLPTTAAASPVGDATMGRLETMSQTQHRSQLTRDWPGDGPPDERLLGIAEAFQRAAELAAGPGRRVRPTTQPEYDDLNAARMRVMHTLYVGAHAVGIAVHQHVDDVRSLTDNHSSARETRAILRGQDAATRIGAFEQLAGSYVGTRFSLVIAGEHHAPTSGTGRLNQALATWDVQAHRTMAATQTPANLHLTARTQAFVATTSTAILGAASATGRLDSDTYAHRLAPALDAGQQAWTRAANRWGALSSRGDRADPALVNAVNELRAAGIDIVFNRTRWATPQVMANRVDLTEAARAVQQAMITGAELSCAYRDVVEQEPHLAGSARTLLTWTRDTSAGPVVRRGTPTDNEAATIAPGAVHANRAVPLPDVVRNSLVGEAGQLVDASETARSASNALTGSQQQSDRAAGCARCRPEEIDRPNWPTGGLRAVGR